MGLCLVTVLEKKLLLGGFLPMHLPNINPTVFDTGEFT